MKMLKKAAKWKDGLHAIWLMIQIGLAVGFATWFGIRYVVGKATEANAAQIQEHRPADKEKTPESTGV